MKRTYFYFWVVLCIWAGLPQIHAQQTQVTLEDIWLRYRYLPDFPPGFRWMNDDNYYSTLNTRGSAAIVKNSILDGKAEVIVNLAELDFGDHFSPAIALLRLGAAD